MLCSACNRESNNLRVCPYCFTPYPVDAGSRQRQTKRMRVAGSNWKALAGRVGETFAKAKAAFLRQTPVVRWATTGIVVVLVLWALTGPGEPTFEPGVVPSDIIATPLQREEALAIIRQTRETALVDIQADEVFVSFPAATFPVREDGQLALVQRFAQADEIVEGRKRRIFFYNPNGKLFAQTDGVAGVVLVR
ncbi:MAG: hypothetical protein WD771_07545 [Gemmatimonadaceae bacterium]